MASIGLRAKTARAIAVVLRGSVASPGCITRCELALASAKTPATLQPYHEVMELPWAESARAVRKAGSAIETIAIKALADLLRDPRLQAFQIAGVGIVGAPERRLEKIGNPHIRAHAAEGVLFRHALEVAAQANGVRCLSFPERDFEQLAAAKLGRPLALLHNRLRDFGAVVGPPWRADEKAAALAAWLALVN